MLWPQKKNSRLNLMVFCMFLSIHKLGGFEARAQAKIKALICTKIRTQKTTGIRVKVLLLLVGVFGIFSVSSFFLMGADLWQVCGKAMIDSKNKL